MLPFQNFFKKIGHSSAKEVKAVFGIKEHADDMLRRAEKRARDKQRVEEYMRAQGLPVPIELTHKIGSGSEMWAPGGLESRTPLPVEPPAWLCSNCDRNVAGEHRVISHDKNFCRTCYDELRGSKYDIDRSEQSRRPEPVFVGPSLEDALWRCQSCKGGGFLLTDEPKPGKFCECCGLLEDIAPSVALASEPKPVSAEKWNRFVLTGVAVEVLDKLPPSITMRLALKAGTITRTMMCSIEEKKIATRFNRSAVNSAGWKLNGAGSALIR